MYMITAKLGFNCIEKGLKHKKTAHGAVFSECGNFLRKARSYYRTKPAPSGLH